MHSEQSIESEQIPQTHTEDWIVRPLIKKEQQNRKKEKWKQANEIHTEHSVVFVLASKIRSKIT